MGLNIVKHIWPWRVRSICMPLSDVIHKEAGAYMATSMLQEVLSDRAGKVFGTGIQKGQHLNSSKPVRKKAMARKNGDTDKQ